MKKLLLPAIFFKLIIGIIVCCYFWIATSIEQVSTLPIWLLVLTVIYIGLQMFSRKYSDANHWWDWIYYIGLLSIMIPVSIIDAENEKLCHLATDIGTLCLVAPPLADVIILIKKSNPQS
ncbi:MAG: hypothetical protein ACK49D_09995 [Flavobacteriia bacterium]|jgi:predicted tellurium resistance membrane protein TerC